MLLPKVKKTFSGAQTSLEAPRPVQYWLEPVQKEA